MSLDTRSGGLLFVSGALGLVALLVLVMVLALVRPGWIGAALGLLALLYFGHMLLAGESKPMEVAFVSVALLLVGELAQWSLDARLRGRYEAGMHRSRAAGIGALAVLGLGAVLLSQVAAGVPIPGGLGTLAVATAAAVGLLGLISIVAIRAGDATR